VPALLEASKAGMQDALPAHSFAQSRGKSGTLQTAVPLAGYSVGSPTRKGVSAPGLHAFKGGQPSSTRTEVPVSDSFSHGDGDGSSINMNQLSGLSSGGRRCSSGYRDHSSRTTDGTGSSSNSACACQGQKRAGRSCSRSQT